MMLHLEAYQSSYKGELSMLLDDYFFETHPDDYIGNPITSKDAIDKMIESGRTIYVLFDYHTIVGFLVTYINDQFHMTKPTIVGEYMYLAPPYRGTVATMYLYLMLGKISEQYGYDVTGTTLSDSSSTSNAKYNDHIEVARVYKAKHEDVVANYQRYKKKLNLN